MKKIILIILLLLPTAHANTCDDSTKIYKSCSSQKVLYQTAFDSAKTNNKLLLVTFGFEACPWCQSLHKIFSDTANQKQLANFELVSIEAKNKDLNGKKVLEDLMTGSSAKVEGYPFLALVNPKNDKKSFINTGDLEVNTAATKGHDLNKVFGAIQKSAKLLK